jgi:hypothetical protein
MGGGGGGSKGAPTKDSDHALGMSAMLPMKDVSDNAPYMGNPQSEMGALSSLQNMAMQRQPQQAPAQNTDNQYLMHLLNSLYGGQR